MGYLPHACLLPTLANKRKHYRVRNYELHTADFCTDACLTLS